MRVRACLTACMLTQHVRRRAHTCVLCFCLHTCRRVVWLCVWPRSTCTRHARPCALIHARSSPAVERREVVVLVDVLLAYLAPRRTTTPQHTMTPHHTTPQHRRTATTPPHTTPHHQNTDAPLQNNSAICALPPNPFCTHSSAHACPYFFITTSIW